MQEASGKTSNLSRADRAVLAAIDGKTPLSEVQNKFEKLAGAKFEALIRQFDKDGYIREVSSGSQSAAPAPRPAAAPAKPPSKPAADDDSDGLDFTQALKIPPRPAAPKPPQMDLAAAARADAERKAKEQEAIDYRARQEVEAKAKAEAKARAEAEAKARAEAEAKARTEAEARARADAEAKVKAAREAAVRMATEAKARAEADAKARTEAAEREKAKLEADLNAKLEAERKAREEAEKRATEAAEQARKELEEKAKRDADEMRQRLEAEMKARLEEERKAREAEDRKRREEEDRRRKEEDERRAKEEAERRAREEEDRKRREEDERRRKEEEARRAKEEAERKAKEEAERKAKEEAERKAKEEAERKAKEEAERKQREEEDRRRKVEDERRAKEDADRRAREESERKAKEEAERKAKDEAERKAKEETERKAREEAERKAKEEAEAKARAAADLAASLPKVEAVPAPPPAAAPAGADLGDLLGDLESFGKKEEEERKAKEEEERKAKEAAARRAQEEAERKAQEEEERKRREEEERRRKAEDERRAREEEERREREEDERRKEEEAERKRKAKEAQTARQAAQQAARATDGDGLQVGDEDLDQDDIKRDQKVMARRGAEAAPSAVVAAAGRPKRWGKTVAIAAFVLLLGGIGVLHVVPVSTPEYEKGAAEALGAPVKIGAARLSLFTGVELKFENVTVGGARIRLVRGSPEIGSLFGAAKSFRKLELEGLSMSQSQLGDALFGKAAGTNFRVGQVTVRQLALDGPLKLPVLDVEATIGADGAVQSVRLAGADKLTVQLSPKGSELAFEINAGSLALPFVPALSLSDFGMKGTASRTGVASSEFDGRAYDGVISGTARIRWGANWTAEGEVRARGLKAAVFAPALVSDGKVEGRAAYSMSGGAPGQLYEGARMQGEFKIDKGVLGSFDLTRALQTGGAQSTGRTVFNEMTGKGVYDKGAVQLRDISMTAGSMNAGASIDIDPSGALSGRVAADVKTPTQTLRTVLNLSGKVQEPVIRK
ncbi:MAG: hypothetical protein IT513_04705 [Burkholderiales bacterium]|nr:hypothetical protein [Burkholderiales bacterium]